MRNWGVYLAVILAAAGTVYGGEAKPSRQGGATQDAGVGEKTEGPPKELTVDLGVGVKMEMVLIPAGSFTMGDAAIGPPHKVNITKPFYLGKSPVTQGQWEAVMGSRRGGGGGLERTSLRNWEQWELVRPYSPTSFKEPKPLAHGRLPATEISWIDSQAFLQKLNEKFGERRGRFRLPTEAEWEYACRAGTTTKWSFGDDGKLLGDYAWVFENAGNNLHPVGQKKPNPWGLYDMHGNMWQWCADWFSSDYYKTSSADDPPGPASGDMRVTRGGSWNRWPLNGTTSAFRGCLTPAKRCGITGFRAARTY
jgi:formylglycine-generating enzyme required for sulfatase activity